MCVNIVLCVLRWNFHLKLCIVTLKTNFKNPIIMRMDLDDNDGKWMESAHFLFYTALDAQYSSFCQKAHWILNISSTCIGADAGKHIFISFDCSKHFQQLFHSLISEIWKFQLSLIWNLFQASKNEFVPCPYEFIQSIKHSWAHKIVFWNIFNSSVENA